MSKKKHNEGNDPSTPISGGEKTTQHTQEIVDKLVWENGSNLPYWYNYAEILMGVGLTPAMVTPAMLSKAERNSRERLYQGAREVNGTALRQKLVVIIDGVPEFDPEYNPELGGLAKSRKEVEDRIKAERLSKLQQFLDKKKIEKEQEKKESQKLNIVQTSTTEGTMKNVKKGKRLVPVGGRGEAPPLKKGARSLKKADKKKPPSRKVRVPDTYKTVNGKVKERENSLRKRSEITFTITTKGIVANGQETSKGFVVLKGSQAVKKEVPSISPSITGIRAFLLGQKVLQSEEKYYVFIQDHTFTSPSLAAAVVMGRAANGLIEWKALGKTLKELHT